MNEVFLGRFQIFMWECIEVIIFREAILRVSTSVSAGKCCLRLQGSFLKK
jgi:hypothetical protein